MNFKNWYQCRFKKMVVLRTIEESEDEEYEYVITEKLIPKSELPSSARHCRGEPFYYSVNKIDHIKTYDIDGFSAYHGWRWLHTDSFDNLLSGVWKLGDHINLGKTLGIIGIVVAIVVVAYFVMKG